MTDCFYPLTASQNMLHSAFLEFGTAQVLTIGVCVTVHASLDFDLLHTCIQEETLRHTCLQLQFTAPAQGNKTMQYFARPVPSKIPHMDMSLMSREEQKEQMTVWSSRGFSQWDGPLFRFVTVTLPGGWNGVYLCIDHRIIDSCGLVSMMKDLLELYCHRRYGTPLPPMPTPYERVLKQELAEEEKGSLDRDTEFWRRLLSGGEPVYTDVQGCRKLTESRGLLGLPKLRAALRTLNPANGDMLHVSLSAPEMKKLFSFCRQQSVSMTNLILMAMRTCLSQSNGDEPDITIRNYVARRSSRQLRSCGGCRIHCYPCRTVIAPQTGFLDGVRLIQSHQNQIYRHCNLDPQVVAEMMAETYGMPHNTTYEGAALTCQPNSFLPDHPLLKRLPMRAEWFSSRADIQKLYLTVMPEVGREELGFYFKYQTADLKQEDVARFYESLRNVLLLGVSKPEIKVGEMLRL